MVKAEKRDCGDVELHWHFFDPGGRASRISQAMICNGCDLGFGKPFILLVLGSKVASNLNWYEGVLAYFANNHSVYRIED